MNTFHHHAGSEPETGAAADAGHAPREPAPKPSRDWRDRCYGDAAATHLSLLAQRLLQARLGTAA
jgi:hypothetical protein